MMILGLCGCVADHGFRCDTGDHCGTGGTCESTGWCSFPDSSCTSGRRYGDQADPAYARMCVEVTGADASVADAPPGTPDARPRPDAPPGTPDARPRPDATPPPDAGLLGPQVRVVSRAWYGASSGTTYASTGMSKTGYSIPVSNVAKGEMLLLLGNIDQGTTSTVPAPTGFGTLWVQPMSRTSSGPQTFFAFWKVASTEPSTYTGTYSSGNNTTGAATFVLLAIDGATSIDQNWWHWDTTSYSTTIVGVPPLGVASVNGEAVLFVMGSDWSTRGGSNTSTPPPGFHLLASFGDHGDDSWDWTSIMVAWGYQPTAGPMSQLMGTMTGTQTGAPWSNLFTLEP
jgi:hypothetical protein